MDYKVPENQVINVLTMAIIAKCTYRTINSETITLYDQSKTAVIQYNIENGQCFFYPTIISETLDKFLPDNAYENYIVDTIKNVFDKYFPDYPVEYIGQRDLSNIKY